MIYLDNSATSPIAQEVFEAMRPYLQEEYGNPPASIICLPPMLLMLWKTAGSGLLS